MRGRGKGKGKAAPAQTNPDNGGPAASVGEDEPRNDVSAPLKFRGRLTLADYSLIMAMPFGLMIFAPRVLIHGANIILLFSIKRNKISHTKSQTFQRT